MPTYEYRCPNGHDFDLFQRMSDDPVATCPECGEVSERMLSAGAGFLFKGDGFYITDYRSESYKKDAAADKSAASTPASSTESSTSSASTDKGSSSTESASKSPAPSSTKKPPPASSDD